MKLRHAALAVSVAFAAGALAVTPLRAAETPLQDSTMATPVVGMGFALEYLAEDLGLYAKHGVRMSSSVIAGLGTINALIGGSVDFAQPSGASLTRAAAKGQPLLAIAETNDRVVVQVVMRNEVAQAAGFDAKAPLAKRALVLKGKTIAVDSINSVIHAYVRLLAKQAGFDPEDINIAVMQPPNMLVALTTKQIDGFAMAAPWTIQPVVEGTATMIASGPDGDDVGLTPFASSVVAARPATCEKNPTLCEAVAQTFVDAAAFMHDHQPEARALLKKRFPTLDAKVFDASFDVQLKMTPSPPIPTKLAIENTDNYNVQAGLMKPEDKLASYDSLYTDKYVK